ncbi:MAG: tRNA-dihydrouridine synthase [Patescibacteria group bacterium]|mgnify:FL=1
MSFWDTLQKPIFALAPLADVTDAAFRRLIAKYSKLSEIGSHSVPYITWTEFVSADGLALAPEEGRKKLLADLIYTEAERPIIAQFFSASPKNMEHAAALARELGFDGVDINMGCPDKSIEKQGAGAAHIKNPGLAQEVIAAAKQGAGDLPVSVKTRLGYNKDELDEWLPKLLAAKPAAVTIHARTRKEMSLVPARWERVARAVEIRNEQSSDALILGNGDLKDVADATAKVAESGADGAMLGRAIFGNPWLFSERGPTSLRERLEVMVEHTKLYEELLMHPSSGLGAGKSFSIMKKHYKAYVSGFDGAAELRAELMNAKDAREVEVVVEAYLTKSH